MKAAVYCRVSTEAQEREGTSLQTQLTACLKYCESKGYEIDHCFSETYSGLSLERPKLDELRQAVRDGQVDAIVVYSLDRLSRDPVHGVILTQEFEKYHVGLEAVTETVDSSDLGKLMTYIKGYAAKLEAEKIRERSIRGRKATAKAGRMPGGFYNTYGYDYLRVIKGEREAHRIVNKIEAPWVKKMFDWLVNEGLSTNQILFRLRDQAAPTKNGKTWVRSSVLAILKNPSYMGKTYAFTRVPGQGQFSRDQEDWIEIPGVTPAIITREIFEAAQQQLQQNREKSSRNCKHDYLLRGHLRCRQCGRVYAGDYTYTRFYKCAGKKKACNPAERCQNKGWKADTLEDMVWAELKQWLGKKDFVEAEIERQRQGAGNEEAYAAELQHIERQLMATEREQRKLLQWALRDFPESQVEAENKRLNQAKKTLNAQRVGVKSQLKACQHAAINKPDLERFILEVQNRMDNLDFKEKQTALDMLGITVWLDRQRIEITGKIDGGIVTIPS